MTVVKFRNIKQLLDRKAVRQVELKLGTGEFEFLALLDVLTMSEVLGCLITLGPDYKSHWRQLAVSMVCNAYDTTSVRDELLVLLNGDDRGRRTVFNVAAASAGSLPAKSKFGKLMECVRWCASTDPTNAPAYVYAKTRNTDHTGRKLRELLG